MMEGETSKLRKELAEREEIVYQKATTYTDKSMKSISAQLSIFKQQFSYNGELHRERGKRLGGWTRRKKRGHDKLGKIKNDPVKHTNIIVYFDTKYIKNKVFISTTNTLEKIASKILALRNKSNKLEPKNSKDIYHVKTTNYPNSKTQHIHINHKRNITKKHYTTKTTNYNTNTTQQ